MFDFIGDIHGYADSLELLLQKLGYIKTEQGYKHSHRKVFFLGDFIDRGPKIRETLHIVKTMIDNGNALAIMGNHEYNAIAYNTLDQNGDFLRKHSAKNRAQHSETINQFKGYENEYNRYIEWFKSLPLFFENENFRVVHACWDQENINFLKKKVKGNCLKENDLKDFSNPNTEDYNAIEETLKGKELKLPDEIFFLDKDGHQRKEIRVKWWEDSSKHDYRTFGVHFDENIPNLPISTDYNFYSEKEKPVFFGHYWLQGLPTILKENVCCLDYSVAKGGKLVAYRFNNEKKLSNNQLVYV